MFLLLGLLFVLPVFYYCYWKGRKLPPGPTPIPLFGNTLSFKHTDMDVQLRNWQKQYGDVHTVWLGSNLPVVCVCDPQLIADNFLKDGDTYADRPFFSWNEVIRKGQYGVVFIDGPNWRDNRRFALHTLRNFGLGRNLMQERVLDEISGLIDNIKSDLKSGSTDLLSIQSEIDIAVGSIINRLVLGFSFSRDQRDLFYKAKNFVQILVKNSGHFLFRAMEENIDAYKNLPLFKGMYSDVVKHSEEMRNFFMKEIERHRQELDLESDEEPTDYVEAFLRYHHKLEKEGNKEHNFSLDQLYGMIVDLWVAGQETTSNTLGWLCVYLIDRPQIQKKLQAELDAVIGSDRLITLNDKVDLHYVNAVVAESQRYCNLLPFNLLHRTTKDVVLGDFKVPAGTAITNQMSCVHMDPRYFPEPEQFKPERFLDAEGKFFQPPELMPFSVGKRSCLGESLARLELFLFTSNIFNQFTLRSGPGYKSPKRILGGTVVPTEYKCHIAVRH